MDTVAKTMTRWTARCYHYGMNVTHTCAGYMDAARHDAADACVGASVVMRQRLARLPQRLPLHPLTHATAAAALSQSLWAAMSYLAPTASALSPGVSVGVTLGAAVFGGCVVQHRWAALGAASGALVGSILVVVSGLSGGLWVSSVIALTVWFGGSVGCLLQNDLDHEALSELENSASAPSPPSAESSRRLPPHRLRLAMALVPQRHPETAALELQPSQDVTDRRLQLRDKLQALEGPLASLYRAKGLHQLRMAEIEQTTDNAAAAQTWLDKLDRLVDTLTPLPPRDAAAIAAFDAGLDAQFNAIWGNQLVKTHIRQCIALQHRGAATMGIVCVTGVSGSGKNLIANAVKSAYHVSHEISLHHLPVESFTGFSRTYVESGPSCVTETLLQAPNNYCVLHIDEIDQASHDKQQALLALLARENQFVDAYFGLPINKTRLLVICTMKADAEGIANLYPDLWNRLKQHAVATSQVTPAGYQQIAERALETEMVTARLPSLSAPQKASAAAEICRNRPKQEPGRYIERSVATVVARAALLSTKPGEDANVSPQLVLRALINTWSQRQTVNLTWSYPWSVDTHERVDCLTLFGVMGTNKTQLRWNSYLDDGRSIKAELSDDFGLKLSLHGPDGAPMRVPLQVDMRMLKLVHPQANEIVSSDVLGDSGAWPLPTYWDDGELDTMDAYKPWQLRRWALPIDNGQMLLALPVSLPLT